MEIQTDFLNIPAMWRGLWQTQTWHIHCDAMGTEHFIQQRQEQPSKHSYKAIFAYKRIMAFSQALASKMKVQSFRFTIYNKEVKIYKESIDFSINSIFVSNSEIMTFNIGKKKD